MAVLFLDPLALASLLGLIGFISLVWHGRFRRWFGARTPWSGVAWPLPAALLLTPIIAGGALALAGRLGMEPDAGGAAGGVAYTFAYGAPLVGLTFWPPRWLLPPWARTRLTALPTAPDAAMPRHARPAVIGQPGHGTRARWTWRIDATPGYVWIDDRWLCFRASSTDLGPHQHEAAAARTDDQPLPELRVSSDGDLRLQQPRGGWWSRRALDLDLTDVDRIVPRARRPWRRDGALTFHVAGRRPVCLWLDDIRSFAHLANRHG